MYNISCHLILRTVQIGYCENEMLNMAKKRGKKKKKKHSLKNTKYTSASTCFFL